MISVWMNKIIRSWLFLPSLVIIFVQLSFLFDLDQMYISQYDIYQMIDQRQKYQLVNVLMQSQPSVLIKCVFRFCYTCGLWHLKNKRISTKSDILRDMAIAVRFNNLNTSPENSPQNRTKSISFLNFIYCICICSHPYSLQPSKTNWS